jgi:hypothetical protein
VRQTLIPALNSIKFHFKQIRATSIQFFLPLVVILNALHHNYRYDRHFDNDDDCDVSCHHPSVDSSLLFAFHKHKLGCKQRGAGGGSRSDAINFQSKHIIGLLLGKYLPPGRGCITELDQIEIETNEERKLPVNYGEGEV